VPEILWTLLLYKGNNCYKKEPRVQDKGPAVQRGDYEAEVVAEVVVEAVAAVAAVAVAVIEVICLVFLHRQIVLVGVADAPEEAIVR
jgi:hypothetical protein